jgi:ribonuclease G
MPGSEPVQEAIQTTPIQAAPPVAPEAIATPEPSPAVEVEYEPEAASASYRIDPVAPSEFRQSAPVLEAPAEIAAAPTIADAAPEAEAPAVPSHDITSITPTGEMLSEPVEVLPDATPHPAPVEVPQLHSAVFQASPEVLVDAGADLTARISEGVATGFGQIEEETLDEEDGESTTLHASSVEELEDLDEEVLEGAADLGTMLREMSIDHITRTAPQTEELDEEDDLEEDDLEEDGETGDFETFEQSESDEASDSEEFSEEAARTGKPSDQEFFETQFGQTGDQSRSESGEGSSAETPVPHRDSGRDGERRGGRRDGRRGRSDRGDRSSSSGDRDRNGHSGGGSRGRHSVQSTNLPAISDLLKPGQEILVQIAKEPIAKKGARITSHIALPGRFLVFMPTVNHTGVSRKIESDGERRRLKEILLSEKGDASGGFIVRTAAEGASEEELRSDLRFLLNLWADIKNRSESSKSPALIYHDLNLIERILRDQVTDTFSAIWVDTEAEYERVLRFLQRFQPSLIRRVKLYSKDTPLFEQFGITEEINKALRSKVWLKSGGSIVINQTEALVAIDINTGKFVGKTARLEDTIVKTNLDAIPEIVRQIRLRDLGGIIIIDFIDMDERKNRNRVMAALEDELKSDRAPSKVLQFNDFGLVAITRKRVKQSLERTLSTTCGVCQGTGMVKSPVTVCNDIYIEMRKMHKLLDRGDVMLRVHPEVVKQLKSSGAKWLQEMEEMVGKTILVKSDPSLHPEQFDIH